MRIGLRRVGLVSSTLLLGCAQQPAPADTEAPLALRAGLTKLGGGLDRGFPGRKQQAEPRRDQASPCKPGMLLVEGSYCPNVEQTCLRYLHPYGRYAKYRCAEYAEPRCLSRRRNQLKFCIDQDEYTAPGARLPQNRKSFVQAQQSCEGQGKRLCTESEWNFSCEGSEMRAYPYGFSRDPSACNADRVNILTPKRALRDLRAASDAFPRCVSPFGVRNLSGNLEEFVVKDASDPPEPVMKGAYWQPGRNACRDRQTVHGAHYAGTETGFRCCSEPQPE